MKSSAIVLLCLPLLSTISFSQPAPTFEVASIKPYDPATRSFGCKGGPGTSDPGTWTCTSVPVAWLISNAYGLLSYQFSPTDNCCTGRFDIVAKVPAGATKEQFLLMQQHLLADRFKLKLHLEKKEMPVYELTVADKGGKLKKAVTDRTVTEQEQGAMPKFSLDNDRFPVFAPGQNGMLGLNGHFRWTEYKLTMAEIARKLAGQLGRPVIDATGLTDRYDVDMKWAVESRPIFGQGRVNNSDAPGASPPEAEFASGMPIERAIQEYLGLKLNSKKGFGEIAVVDHIEKEPVEN